MIRWFVNLHNFRWQGVCSPKPNILWERPFVLHFICENSFHQKLNLKFVEFDPQTGNWQWKRARNAIEPKQIITAMLNVKTNANDFFSLVRAFILRPHPCQVVGMVLVCVMCFVCLFCPLFDFYQVQASTAAVTTRRSVVALPSDYLLCLL